MIHEHLFPVVRMDYVQNAASFPRVAKECSTLAVLLVTSVLFFSGCRTAHTPFIAAIPRTTGIALWEPVREGALAAVGSNTTLYWNAPTRQDDVEGQIALLERETKRNGLIGIILAADHSVALLTPVRRLLRRGIPVVVISSPLAIPAAGKLTYILNDEDEGGKLAADRAGALLHGRGSVAMLGIDPGSVGVMERARSFEGRLAHTYPGIKIVEKRIGTFNLPREQQVAAETLRAFPNLQVLVSFNSTAMRGAYFALADSHRAESVKLIGFDQDIAFDHVKDGKIDSVIVEDTCQMGYRAAEEILASARNAAVPPVVKLKPVLVNRDDLTSPQVQRILLFNWRLLH